MRVLICKSCHAASHIRIALVLSCWVDVHGVDRVNGDLSCLEDAPLANAEWTPAIPRGAEPRSVSEEPGAHQQIIYTFCPNYCDLTLTSV